MSRNSKKPADMSVLFHSSTGTLAQIAKKANSLTKLADIVRQICPDLPEQGYQLGNVKDKTLTIEVANSVWGQRLQFERNRLAQAFSQASQGLISHIDIKVMPFLAHQRRQQENIAEKLAEKRQASAKKVIPAQAGEQLLQAAEHAPASLQAKIARLAALADKNNQQK